MYFITYKNGENEHEKLRDSNWTIPRRDWCMNWPGATLPQLSPVFAAYFCSLPPLYIHTYHIYIHIPIHIHAPIWEENMNPIPIP